MPSHAIQVDLQPARLVGVWIDRSRARIVEMIGDAVRQQTIESDVEHKSRSTGGTRMPGRAYVRNFSSSEKQRDRHRQEHLARYYREVIKALALADRLVLMGPGGAKTELAKLVAGDARLASKLVSTVAAEKMTDRQLVAEIKTFFH